LPAGSATVAAVAATSAGVPGFAAWDPSSTSAKGVNNMKVDPPIKKEPKIAKEHTMTVGLKKTAAQKGMERKGRITRVLDDSSENDDDGAYDGADGADELDVHEAGKGFIDGSVQSSRHSSDDYEDSFIDDSGLADDSDLRPQANLTHLMLAAAEDMSAVASSASVPLSKAAAQSKIDAMVAAEAKRLFKRAMQKGAKAGTYSAEKMLFCDEDLPVSSGDEEAGKKSAEPPKPAKDKKLTKSKDDKSPKSSPMSPKSSAKSPKSPNSDQSTPPKALKAPKSAAPSKSTVKRTLSFSSPSSEARASKRTRTQPNVLDL